MKPSQAEFLLIQLEALLRRFPEIAEDKVLRADMFEGETEISDVLTDLIRLGEDARALRDGTKEQLARLKERAERFDRRLAFSRAFMAALLETANLRRWELPEATVFLRNNPPTVVGEIDGDKLPDDLVEIVRKPNKAFIKLALQEGRVIEGLQLSNSPPSITVLVK
jgi:hypothetical protein